jgi:urease accessory protein
VVEGVTPAHVGIRAGAALALVLFSDCAYAHSGVQGMGDFYAGLLHPLTALEHVLPFFALGLLTGQQGTKSQGAPALFAVALMLGAAACLWLPGAPAIDLVNVVSVLILGALIAAAFSLPTPAYLGLALLFGLSHGYANGAAIVPPMKGYLFILGVGLAGLVVTGYGLVVTDYVLRKNVSWMRVGVRVAGSWIAAIGMLVLATSWKRLVA